MWHSVKKRPEPALFLHIQKTAGSSVIHLAMRSYETMWGRAFLRTSRYIESIAHYCKFNVVSHGDYIGHNPEEFEHVDFVSGHFGYDFARHFIASRYSFVFLRNPVERILSFYYYCKNDTTEQYPINHLVRKLELEQFLMAAFENPLIRSCIWNHQVWQLAHGWGCLDQKGIDDFNPDELLELAIGHLQYFSHVGFTETFENDMDIICKALEWPIPEEKVFSNVGAKRQLVDELSSTAIDLLDKLTQLDQVLYATAWATRHPDGVVNDKMDYDAFPPF